MFEETEINLINSILEFSNKYSHITPREIKNIINILVISKEISVMSNHLAIYDKSIKYENYIKWFLFNYFNKSTANKLMNKLMASKDTIYKGFMQQ